MIKYTMKHCEVCQKDYKVKPDYLQYFADQTIIAKEILKKYKPIEEIDDLKDIDICADCAVIIKEVDADAAAYFIASLEKRIAKKNKTPGGGKKV